MFSATRTTMVRECCCFTGECDACAEVGSGARWFQAAGFDAQAVNSRIAQAMLGRRIIKVCISLPR